MDQAGQAGPYDSLRLWTTGLRQVLAGLGLATAIERPERPEAILPAWMPNVLTTVPGLPIRRGLGHTCRRRQVCAPPSESPPDRGPKRVLKREHPA